MPHAEASQERRLSRRGLRQGFVKRPSVVFVADDNCADAAGEHLGGQYVLLLRDTAEINVGRGAEDSLALAEGRCGDEDSRGHSVKDSLVLYSGTTGRVALTHSQQRKPTVYMPAEMRKIVW